jgi:exonuclease VII large subunit
VIAAIGHDKDVPLLSLVADKMVSTPTAAANLLNQSWQEAELELKSMEREIFNSFSGALRNLEYRTNNLFLKIKDKLEKVISLFKMIEFRIKSVIPKILESEIKKLGNKLENIEKIINQNNPERNLKLGYCIATNKKGVIKNINEIVVDDIIDLKVYNGIINTQVKKIQKNERKKS